MEWLKTWVYNIAVFIVFISIIELIMPKKKYKKYIKLVLGLIFILVIVEPFLTLLGYSNYLQTNTMTSELVIEQHNVKIGLDNYSDKQNDIVRKQYEIMILDQIETLLSNNSINLISGDIEFYEDEQHYGEIKRMELVVTKEEADLLDGDSIVEPILIDSIELSKREEPTEQNDILFENKVKGILVEFYQVDKDIIEIRILNDKEVGN